MQRLVVSALAFAMLAGCAGINDQTRTTVEGGAVGAGAGAGVGYVICGEECAALGGLLGGAVGAVGGMILGQTKEEIAANEDMLEQQTQRIASRVNNTRHVNGELRQQVVALDSEIFALNSARVEGIDTRQQTEAARQRVEAAAAGAERELAEVDEELQTTRSLLADAHGRDEIEVVTTEKLEKVVADLQRQRDTLASYASDLRAQGRSL